MTRVERPADSFPFPMFHSRQRKAIYEINPHVVREINVSIHDEVNYG